MPNPVAIFLGVTIVGLVLADLLITGGTNLVYLGKKFAEFIEWIAFWR